jgi:hypothetical protein
MEEVGDPMSDNILQTLQQLVQDVIAPDVRELNVRVGSLEKRLDLFEKHVDDRFNAMEKRVDVRFDALDQKSEARFDAIMAAIAESRAQSELSVFRMVAALSERVPVLEAQRH